MDDSFDELQIDWTKVGGLLPAIVQNQLSGQVLMLGYMNGAALAKTRASGKVTFYSRSRERLWTKGETSGNALLLKSVRIDCDGDALLILVEPLGPACHTGTSSCFGDADATRPPAGFLAELDALVARRCRRRQDGSYTSSLFEAGVRRVAQKVGEEATEVALAAVSESDARVLGEAADLLFHLNVLLRARGLSLADVTDALAERHTQKQGA
ncbi:MAG TPA: bifunctional phosphoribosyl-AMP cyclohydrolase/phosphoribosyl-ATP diphosphatase HisIE [Gammaproteobacteria bacterium]|nr:bifunctional phosphoribosyl-AMP cyclohydrolase/phosphoribosyl-ATP diphosphatase HisIE [Gammaproteobacteria bacterium]